MKKKLRRHERIVVGLSGGVDSSVAAALLVRAGYDVIGVTLKTWPKEECGLSVGRACCDLEAITRSRFVCETLCIPHYVIDASAAFKADVIDYFCREYMTGRTPNPCVVCNEKIKFGILLEKAHALGATKIATGHFARVAHDARRRRFVLREGIDRQKAQAYFLFMLSQEQLAHALFPLGNYTKVRVRAIAKRLKLKTYDTVSSQDVCFIQDMDYATYIQKKAGVTATAGDIVDTNGAVRGRHQGIIFYTLGQRRGLGIAHREPLYVTGIDAAHNRIIVGTKRDVRKAHLIAERLNWIAIDALHKPFTATVKIRYNHRPVKARITKIEPDAVRVDFDQPQEAPTPGQAAVFYHRDLVIGGGWIREAW